MPRARSIASPSSAVALAEEEAPKGRKIPAQGNALGHSPPKNRSPEGAEQQAMPMIPLGKIADVKLGKMLDRTKHKIGRNLPYLRNINVRWDYEDLQRAVSQNTGRKGNSLYEIVKAANPDLEESAFVDAVSRSLREGRFLLLILGDGIREGAGSITNFIEKVGSLEFTFGLVELGLYQRDGEDMVFVQPRVLARTEIIRRSIVTIREGRPVMKKRRLQS